MTRKQSKKELEEFYIKKDPWGYETNIDDLRRRAEILSFMPEANNVLEIGCGEGFISESIRTRIKYTLTMLDISETAIKRCKKRMSRFDKPPKHSFIIGDIYNISTYALFDLIVACGILYGATDEDMENIIGHAPPGTKFLSCHINHWNYNHEWMEKHLKLRMTRIFKYREFTERLEIFDIPIPQSTS